MNLVMFQLLYIVRIDLISVGSGKALHPHTYHNVHAGLSLVASEGQFMVVAYGVCIQCFSFESLLLLVVLVQYFIIYKN